MDAFADRLLAIPETIKWALAMLGVALGLPMILAPGAIIRALRKWLLVQLRWLRLPAYRRMLKIYGWLLLATGVMLIILLALTRRP